MTLRISRSKSTSLRTPDYMAQILIGRALAADVDAAAEAWLHSRKASVPGVPAPVHSDAAVRAWFADVVFPKRDLWVAKSGGGVVALLVLEDDWIDQLYVRPDHFGRGLGGRLVAVAKQQRPEGLRLWTFTSNVRAQRFYEGHGFVATGATASDNEERAPATCYQWTPDGDSEPLIR